MKPSKVQELGLKIKAKNDEVLAIHAKYDEEGADHTSYSDDDKTRVKALNREIEDFEKQVADSQEWNDSREAAEKRKSGAVIHPGSDDKNPQSKTLSGMVLENPDFKAWREQITKGGSTQAGSFGNSPSVPLGVSAKALVTGLSSTSAGALIISDHKPIVDPGTFYREITVFDLITMGDTDSDAVEYVRQGTHTNNAAPTPEATGTNNGTGSAPESNFVLERVTATVKDVTHFLAATRNSLADAGQMRTLIDTFLRYGLQEELEDQIVAGSGTGDNFTGMLNYTGTTARSFITDIATTTRKARTLVRTTGKARANGYLMHPNDWEEFDLLQDNEGRYFYGGPSVLGTPRLWGLPVIESEAITENTAMCADFRLAALWMREQANISISDSHLDFFSRRMVAILAACRGAFELIRPAAFVEIALA